MIVHCEIDLSHLQKASLDMVSKSSSGTTAEAIRLSLRGLLKSLCCLHCGLSGVVHEGGVLDRIPT